MSFGWASSAADRRLLPEGRLAGPMPWVIAIMMFLTVLSAAGGLALSAAANRFGEGLAGRVTVQILETDPAARAAQATAADRAIRGISGVVSVRRVADAEVAALLAPWIGREVLGDEVPLPALIDVDLAPGDTVARAAVEAAVRRVSPAARIDDQAQWLASLGGLLRAFRWLAAGLVLLIAAATAAAVVLAARGAMNTHRGTIDVLHLMGATDAQIARLFQRRSALDSLFGGSIGFAGAALVLVLLSRQIARIDAGASAAVALGWQQWLALLLLPLAGAALATLSARITVTRALGRLL